MSYSRTVPPRAAGAATGYQRSVRPVATDYQRSVHPATPGYQRSDRPAEHDSMSPATTQRGAVQQPRQQLHT